MNRRSRSVGALLFFSGMCALIYQVAWLRELRLVFGASTPASAAVLAVFMGGLGAGSLLLGRRAERAANPLALYAHLELGIAVSAALTPGLLYLARAGYLAAGGTSTLGLGLGTVVRLVLSALVLLPPTLMMGGTLPAAARAATGVGDVGRRSTALLYGLNTLGAVTGAAAATFALLEIFGTRATLWLGCLINALVGMAARSLARSLAAPAVTADAATGESVVAASPTADAATGESVVAAAPTADAATGESVVAAAPTAESADGDSASQGPAPAPMLPPRFVLAAAAATGFVFLLMELVWYRMLSPLLGGSSYTFGLILAVALFGVGVGGLLYTLRGAARAATVSAFALTCALEALFTALPFAAGDRIAWLALFLRSMGSIGLAGHTAAWTIITAVLVLPAAIVAGYQFPLLIALLGRGGRELGRHVGVAYASNTAGAIVGSLVGGFLLPHVGALGAWKLTVWMLAAMCVAALGFELRAGPRRAPSTVPLLVALAAVASMQLALGPTSFWRHSPIGTGRADTYVQGATRNMMKERWRQGNRAISWDADGRESTVAAYTLDDTSFFVNGKSDGAAYADGGTQVMGGMLGALLHPRGVKRALVIGLGTGSTAGWLGRLPGIERVDVVELEPAILRVASECTPVNADALNNPKVRLIIADAREVLLTTRDKYDLIFSEPSNPYRAGIASLFTREFYDAVRKRLEPGGVFVQWLQAYEIDSISVRTIYTTLAAVFPSVESWRTKDTDIVLINREADRPVDVGELRARIGSAPFSEALMAVWRATTVEDVLARFLARPSFARAIAEAEGELRINTDDLNALEFSVARALGRRPDFNIDELLLASHQRGEARPELAEGTGRVDWRLVFDGMISMRLIADGPPRPPPHLELPPDMAHRVKAQAAWTSDKPASVIRAWESQSKPPTNPIELMVMADAYAVTGARAQAEPLLAKLAEVQPAEADAIAAKLAFAEGDTAGAWQRLSRAFTAYRQVPWLNRHLMESSLPLARELCARDEKLYPEIEAALREEFAVHLLGDARREIHLDLTLKYGKGECVDAIAAYGKWFPWQAPMLTKRVQCYARNDRPELTSAQAELEELLGDAGVDFGASIRPEEPLPRVRFAAPGGEPAAEPAAQPATAPAGSASSVTAP